MKDNTMCTVRPAQLKDKKDFDRLWDICFGDSEAFRSWFFEHRFLPEYSIVLEEEGEIRSCMQAFPYTISIRGKNITGAMLCGVSTHPEHRKKGYMGKIFSYEMNHLRQIGCAVAVHTPAVLSSYFSFGHLPVADAAYLNRNVTVSQKKSEHMCMIKEEQWKDLFPLYDDFSHEYSGIIKRTEEDFLRKAADYAADGGKAIAYIEENQIKGYAFYYEMEKEISCVEVVAEEGYWKQLLEGLISCHQDVSVTAKLPPEIDNILENVERRQKGVMGLCNISLLLKQLDLNVPFAFSVKDHVVPENNGVFTFQGERSDDNPVFEIEAGILLQILVGYLALSECKDKITVFDETKYNEIDHKLPKQKCYIIDEY